MKTKLDASDKLLEAVSLIFLIAPVLIIGFSISDLPDIIPTHFNFEGVPNDYGSKNTLWVVPGVSVFIYMITGLISSYPNLYNYPSEKADKEGQYKLGSKLVRSLRAWILLFIAILGYMMIYSAKSGTAKGAGWFIGIMLTVIAAHLIWFFRQWKKIK